MCSNDLMVAGYSGTPLKQKLGLNDGFDVVVVNEPPGFRDLLDTGPDEVTFKVSLRGNVDVVVVFVTEQAELRRRRELLGKAIFPDGGDLGGVAEEGVERADRHHRGHRA